MKLNSIEITNMHNIVGTKKVAFNNATYLYGPNGAGKSTILQAIQLAILGYIPGLPKTNPEIFKNCNSATLAVSAEFDNGKVIQRTWQKSGASISYSDNLNGEDTKKLIGDLELPIFNFNDFLSLSANKCKDWFIAFLPASDKLLDWKFELTNSIKKFNLVDASLIDETVKTFESDCKGADNLESVRNANTWLKEQQSFIKGEISRTNSTIQSLIFYDDEQVTGDIDEIIHGYKEEIHDIESKIKKIQEAENIIKSNLSIQSMIDNIQLSADCPENDTQIAEAKLKIVPKETIDEYKEEFSRINSLGTGLKDEITQINAEITTKTAIINSNGECPYTKTTCPSIQTMIDQLKTEVLNSKSIIDEKTKQMNELRNQAVDMQSKIAEAKNINSSMQYLINDITTMYTTKKTYESKLLPVPEVDNSISIDEYNSKISQLRDKIAKLEANKKYNELIDNLTKEKYKLESTQEAYKVWAKLTDANGLQTSIMNEPFTNLENDMTLYLKKMFNNDNVECHFVLENKANSFDFGLIRDANTFIPFSQLSSGEKTMYTVALMLCLVCRSNSDLKLLIIDDMFDHLSDENAEHLFESIKNIKDIQFILAGVKHAKSVESFLVEV